MENRIKFRDIPGCYMIATIATHRCCYFSDTNPQLCFIYGEMIEDEQEYWVGRWYFNYINVRDVKFPKKTTRSLINGDVMSYSPELLTDIRNGVYTNPNLIKSQI